MLHSCHVQDGIRRRLLSIRTCTDRSRNPISYCLMNDGFLLMYGKKRCYYMSFSTSTSRSDVSSFGAKVNSEGTFNVTRRPHRSSLEADNLMKKDVGSFQYPQDYDLAHDWIDEVVKNDSPSPNEINLSVHLFERVVLEYSQLLASHNKDTHSERKSARDQSLWFCNPFYVTTLFSQWRDAAIKNEDVLSPRDMLQKLQNMSALLPEHFRYSIETMNIIMHALIRKEPPHRAPFVAEKLFDFIAADYAARVEHGDTAMRPTSYTYNMVLQAWSESGLPDAPVKMEQILNAVHKENCSTEIRSDDHAKSFVCYKVCLLFWCKLKNIEKIDATMSLLDEIEHLRDTIDGFLFSMVIGAYVQARQVHKGEDLYFRMLRQCLPLKSAKSLGKIDNEMVNGLMMSAVSLLTFYRHEIAATLHQSHTPIPESSKQLVHLYTERAETILKQMEAFRDIDHGSFVGK
jgi:pentatricopeptide repeat protein